MIVEKCFDSCKDSVKAIGRMLSRQGNFGLKEQTTEAKMKDSTSALDELKQNHLTPFTTGDFGLAEMYLNQHDDLFKVAYDKYDSLNSAVRRATIARGQAEARKKRMENDLASRSANSGGATPPSVTS